MKWRSERGARRHLRFWGPDVGADIEDEIACHIDMMAAELERSGMTSAQAHAQALAQFGDMAGAKRACVQIDEQVRRRERRSDWFDAIRQDVRYATRSLLKTPAFTVVAVLALGLGVGANAAVFSLVDAAAFRPLPVHAPDELQGLFSVQGKSDLDQFSYPAIEALREDRGPYRDFAGFAEGPASLSSGGDANVVWSNMVTDNYFSVLELAPEVGRLINPGDMRSAVVVLSHDLWKRQFASDRSVIGRTIQLNGYPFTVIGVAPERFLTTRLFSFAPSVWVPAGMHEQVRPGTPTMLTSVTWTPFQVIARLPRGSSAVAARGTLDRIAGTLHQRYPDAYRDWKIVTFSNRTAINPWLAKPEQLRAIGYVVLAGIALVLLIACADVANLLLARMTVRRGEVAVRLALGASRGRLVRQFMTESVVLSLLGACAAIPLAAVAVQYSSRLAPAMDFVTAYHPMLDVRAFVFNGVIALAAGLVFGIAPAIRGSRANLSSALRDEGRGSTTAGGRLREGLVVLQIAVSLVILVAAGLFTQSLRRARAADPGFRPDGAVVFTLDPQLARGYDSITTQRMYDDATAKLRALGGVTSVSRTTTVPLDGNASAQELFPEGGTAPASEGDWVGYNIVGNDYFDAMGMRIIEGRTFGEVDRTRDVEPVVVNRAFAEKFWPGQSPIGRRLRVNRPDGPLVQVIGVTPTARYERISEDPKPYMSYSLLRTPYARTTFIVRSSIAPELLFAQIRGVMHQVDPNLPLTGLSTLRRHIGVSYSAHESGAFGAASFGILALLLAAAGLYGVISYNVLQRRREIGLRVALGSSAGGVVQMILRSALKLAGIGVVIGIGLSLAAGPALRNMLFQTSPRDPLVIGAVAAFLCVVAVTASAIPAMRVARLDPGRALRE